MVEYRVRLVGIFVDKIVANIIITGLTVGIISVPVSVIVMDKTVAPFAAVIFVFITGTANRSVTVSVIVVAEISLAAAVTGECPVIIAITTNHAVLDLVKIFTINNAAAAAASYFTHIDSPLKRKKTAGSSAASDGQFFMLILFLFVSGYLLPWLIVPVSFRLCCVRRILQALYQA